MSRPPFEFHGFIGQRRKVEPLIREVRGAKACGKPACHTAIRGLSGTGKSTLARAIAKEYGARFLKLSGEVARPKLLAELGKVQEGDFLFIDEAHGLAVALHDGLDRYDSAQTRWFRWLHRLESTPTRNRRTAKVQGFLETVGEREIPWLHKRLASVDLAA